MLSVFGERLRAAFAPPRYIALPSSGVDLSTSGIKVVRLAESAHGLILSHYAQSRLPLGAFTDGEIVDHAAVVEALSTAARAAEISAANVALVDPGPHFFEIDTPGIKRNVDDILFVCDQANIGVRALEEESFSIARALLPTGDTSTALLIDIGRTTTKLAIVAGRIPRFAMTIGIGGHALTLAVQKHFGVTEAEARRVKAERGIVPAPGNKNYLAAMLSTISAIRDEICRRLEYWQERAALSGAHEPVSHAILAGGNASVRGLPEYFEGALRIPVTTGDVFTNLASHDAWIPELDYTESLAYATAIGLALRDTMQPYA
jgi:Tfp pilus assembly PilM family ATPase